MARGSPAVGAGRLQHVRRVLRNQNSRKGTQEKEIGINYIIEKSLLTSLFQREGWFDRLTMTCVILSLSKDEKEGQGEIL
jgi:hypothetical protein